MLAHYGNTAGVTDLTAGTITGVTWSPVTSAITASDVTIGLTLYTKVTFITASSIPANGLAVITFQDVNIMTPAYKQEIDESDSTDYDSYCYINSAIDGATCGTTSGTILTLTFTKPQAAGSISVTILTTFQASPKILSISTTSLSLNIDITTAAVSWTLGTATSLDSYKFFKYNSLAHADIDSNNWTRDLQYGGDGGDYLWWILDPDNSHNWGDTTNVVVNLDYVDTGIALEQVYIHDTAVTYDAILSDTNLRSDTAGERSLSASSVATYDLSTTGQIKASGVATINSGSRFCFALGGTGKVGLPLAASNLATFYETIAKATTGTVIDIGVAQFAVYLRTGEPNMTFLPLCATDLAGIPMVLQYNAAQLATDFTSVVYRFAIEVTVDGETDFGTDLDYLDGSVNIPVSSDISTVTAQLTEAGTLVFKGLGKVELGDETITVFVSKGLLNVASNGKFTSTLTLYYTYATGDITTKYELFQFADSVGVTITEAEIDFSAASVTNVYTVDSISDLEISVTGPTTSAGQYFGIGLPSGWSIDPDVSDTSILLSIDALSPTVEYRVSSKDTRSFVMGIVAENSFDLNGNSQNLKMTGVLTPSAKSTLEDSDASYTLFIASSTIGSACIRADTVTKNDGFTTRPISLIDISPKELLYRGPDNLLNEVIIKFSTVSTIPDSGKIIIDLEDSWSWPDDCSILIGELAVKNAICLITGTTLRVTGLSEIQAESEITIKIYPVSPPIDDGDVGHIISLSTQDASDDYIDSISSTSDLLIDTATITANPTQFSSSEISVQVWPSFAGQEDVDVWLGLSFPYNLPAGSVITIDAGFSD